MSDLGNMAAGEFGTRFPSAWLALAALTCLLLGLAAVFHQGISTLLFTARPRRREDMRNPASQIDAVAKVDFIATRMMDETESSMFRILETIVAELAPACRVMARTSLAELLRPATGDAEARRRALASIHSKRLDFAVVDATGSLVAAIGWSERALQIGVSRDQVRREAVIRAGIPYLEIGPQTGIETLCRRLNDAITPRRV